MEFEYERVPARVLAVGIALDNALDINPGKDGPEGFRIEFGIFGQSLFREPGGLCCINGYNLPAPLLTCTALANPVLAMKSCKNAT